MADRELEVVNVSFKAKKDVDGEKTQCLWGTKREGMVRGRERKGVRAGRIVGNGIRRRELK